MQSLLAAQDGGKIPSRAVWFGPPPHMQAPLTHFPLCFGQYSKQSLSLEHEYSRVVTLASALGSVDNELHKRMRDKQDETAYRITMKANFREAVMSVY